MRIIAPNTKHVTDNVILDIQKCEIIKISCHLSSALSILFVWATKNCGTFIRESLDMVRSSDIFYDPSSSGNGHNNKIILQVDNMSDETKTTIKSIFTNQIMDEISRHDALSLLQQSLRNTETVKTDTNANSR